MELTRPTAPPMIVQGHSTVSSMSSERINRTLSPNTSAAILQTLRRDIPVVQGCPAAAQLPSPGQTTITSPGHQTRSSPGSQTRQTWPTDVSTIMGGSRPQQRLPAHEKALSTRTTSPPALSARTGGLLPTRPPASQPVSSGQVTSMPSQAAGCKTPEPQGFSANTPAFSVSLNETVDPSPTGLQLVAHQGPTSTLETIVLDLQKSVELLLQDSEKTLIRDMVESQHLWRSSIEGNIEVRLQQQAQLLESIQSRLNKQDDVIADMDKGMKEIPLTIHSSRKAMDGISDVERRLSKFEKHLPELMVEQDMQARLAQLEAFLQTANEEAMKFDRRMKQQAQEIEAVQFVKATEDSNLEELRLRQEALEEKAKQFFDDALLCNRQSQDCIAAVDARLRKLEDAAETQDMNSTHWESVHLLCDNVQVQQQQQMDVINSLRNDRAQQMQLVNDLQSDRIKQMESHQSERLSVEARLKALEDMSLESNMNTAKWDSINELIGHVNAQQDQHATVIHGLQSEIQTLLREYLAGMPAQPTFSESPRGASDRQTPPPDRRTPPPDQRHSPPNSARSSLGRKSPPPERQTPPNSTRSNLGLNTAAVNGQKQSHISSQRLPSPSPVSQHQLDDAVMIENMNLHPELQMELAKFPQFSTVASAQTNLVRLPQLR